MSEFAGRALRMTESAGRAPRGNTSLHDATAEQNRIEAPRQRREVSAHATMLVDAAPSA